jgi:ABC-type transporter Mla MlaB component
VHIDLLKTANVKPHYSEVTSCLQLIVDGDLKTTTVPALHRDISIILKSECLLVLKIATLELDITAASMVDSIGLNLVLTVLKWSTHSNADSRIIVGTRSVYETLMAIGIDRHAELVYRD